MGMPFSYVTPKDVTPTMCEMKANFYFLGAEVKTASAESQEPLEKDNNNT